MTPAAGYARTGTGTGASTSTSTRTSTSTSTGTSTSTISSTISRANYTTSILVHWGIARVSNGASEYG